MMDGVQFEMPPCLIIVSTCVRLDMGLQVEIRRADTSGVGFVQVEVNRVKDSSRGGALD